MENRKWHAKSEMLQDLVNVGVVTGSTGDIRTVADKPHALILKEDDEYECQRYGRAGDTSQETIKPDLCNISKMLNMVDHYERTTHDEPEQQLQNSAIVITKSKLNPSVNEFKPTNSTSKMNNVEESDQRNTNEISSNTYDNNDDCKITKEHDLEIEENKTQNEIVAQASVLKSKIVENSKNNTMKTKRARNLAIAELMKLYSDPPSEQPREASYKLLTPDHFQTTKLTNEQNHETPEVPPKPVEVESPKPVATKVIVEEEKQDLGVHPKDMENSIKKVSGWLEGPEAVAPKLTLSLNPIGFKRKPNSLLATPERSQTVSPATTSSCKNFVSTNGELFKKIFEDSERVKQAQRCNESIWDKASRLMKEKEANAKPGELQRKKGKTRK